MDSSHGGASDRPAFMAALGLLPPYTREDVETAYRALVWKAHPDRGGAVADFLALQEAYDRAIEYLHFHGDRRGWIAAQVDVYLRQQEAVDEVLRLGGQVEMEEIDWLKHSLGDGFALLADRLRCIRLAGSPADDALVAFLAGPPPRVPYLLDLDLASTRITDQALQSLVAFGLLQKLNVAQTRVSPPAIHSLLQRLPELESLEVQGTGMSLLARWRLRRLLARRRAESDRARVVLLPR